MDLLKNVLLSVVEVSVSTGIIVLILLLFAPFFDKRYAARWRYYIWIILAVRLVIPANFSLPEKRIEISIPPSASVSAADIAEDGIPVMLQTERAAQRTSGFSVLEGMAVIWFAVSVCIVLVHICSYWHYKRKLVRSGRHVTDEAVRQQFLALKRELKIRKKITVLQCPNTESPMVIGFFRTFLVIPEGVYSEEELFFIFRHELIHFKWHDTFLKFLFMAARAVHWFNPVIAVMQREAAIDMELSCDERVVQGISDSGRKAYTETLLSALERQCGKTNTLTTQFNGGSRVMKRRFQNILGRSGQKRGLFLLILVVCMTLVFGTMTGCTVAQTESPGNPDGQEYQAQKTGEQEALQGEESSEQDQTQSGSGGTQPREDQAQNGSGDVQPQEDQAQSGSWDMQTQEGQAQGGEGNVQSQTVQEDPQSSGRTPVLSEDAMEIGTVASDFSRAFFDGDQEELGKFLADTYDGDVEIYPDAEPKVVGMTAVRGLEDIGESQIGDTQVVSVACDRADTGEGLLYLTLEMIKQENGWKVSFYGLEM